MADSVFDAFNDANLFDSAVSVNQNEVSLDLGFGLETFQSFDKLDFVCDLPLCQPITSDDGKVRNIDTPDLLEKDPNKSPFHESVTSDYSSMCDLGEATSPGLESNSGDEYAAINFDVLLAQDNDDNSSPDQELMSYLETFTSPAGADCEDGQGYPLQRDSMDTENGESSGEVDIINLINSAKSEMDQPNVNVGSGSSAKQITKRNDKISTAIHVRSKQSEARTNKMKVCSVPSNSIDQMSDSHNDSDVVAERNRKAAIQARINRQKKKHYINGLEEQVSELTNENEQLRKNNKTLLKEKSSLEEEVEYLKSVLANDSALSGLLHNIGNLKSVSLTTSFATSRKRSAEHVETDHDYPIPSKCRKSKSISKPQVSGGVCLHVENENVSLEFCSKCAQMAKGAGQNSKS